MLLAITSAGGLGAWITGTARLPFVLGLGHYLPERLGAIHPRYGSPHVALLVQAVAASLVLLDDDFSTIVAAIEQGYVQYLAPIGDGLTLKAGKFSTPIGYEVAGTIYNQNITRGNVWPKRNDRPVSRFASVTTAGLNRCGSIL